MSKKVGSMLNLEFDLLAKYVEKLAASNLKV
jgi:riboflavin synthase alpha subunit